MEHAPQNVLENFVLVVATAHPVKIVVVVINVGLNCIGESCSTDGDCASG